MAQLAKHKSVAAPFSKELGVVRVVYDFAEDGGALGAKDVFTAQGALVLKSFHAVVKSACTSLGSAVLDLGVKAGDTDALLDGVAVAALTANSLHADPLVTGTPNTRLVPMYLADGAVIEMTIGTAALTAGKIEFVFQFMKV